MESSSNPRSREPFGPEPASNGTMAPVSSGFPATPEALRGSAPDDRSTQDDVELDYDAFPYEGACFDHTHPNRLAVMARLFGLTAPDIETARVLELGCASGENLIPMAAQLPGATFVGTDLSGRQIQAGRRLIDDLGLRNIRLERVDILDLTERDGVFDYIICHGVYSWVPDHVRAKILEVVRTNLAPDGVACISYNVYPGWHQRQTVREIMLYAAETHSAPGERVQAARAALEFVSSAIVEPGSTYAHAMRAMNDLIGKSRDAYVFHDYMERHNRPFWFHEFWNSLTENELVYVTDTHLGSGLPPDTRDDVRRKLEALSANRVRYEQYVDFIRNRTFRQSVIAKGKRFPAHEPRLDQLESLYVSAELSRSQGEEGDVATDATMVFQNGRQQEIRTNDPLVKTVLWELSAAFPGAVTIEALRQRSAVRAPGAASLAPGTPHLGRLVLRLVASGSAELHVVPPPTATTLSNRPEASVIARHFAAEGPEVPNQRHRQVRLSDVERETLVLLDGTRTLVEVAQGLLARIRDGALTISRQGAPLDLEALQLVIPALVERMVGRFLKQSLLVDAAASGAPRSHALH